MQNIIKQSEPQDVSMSNDWYELTDTKHFWIQWRFRLFQSLIKLFVNQNTKILEIGCGNGLVMYQIEQSMNLVIDGCDLNSYALNNMFEISGKVFLYDIFDLKPVMLNQYDVIILLDVIEHIDGDKDFLETALKYLRKDGLIIVGVPALQCLYSKYDKIVGHVRRYSIRDINKTFEATGIEKIRTQYWGFSLVFLLLIRKIYLYFSNSKDVIRKGFKPPGRISNWILIQIMKIETFISLKTIIGTSILAIGRKR